MSGNYEVAAKRSSSGSSDTAYERVYAVGQPRYLPKTTAPGKEWRGQSRAHGIEGGVIVQISFFGTDNSELLNALRALGT